MKVYWQREGKNIFARGIASSTSEIPVDGKHYFGGLSFSSKKKDSLWQDFPSSFFFVPQIIEENIVIPSAFLPKPIRRLDFPDYPTWEKRVKKALEQKQLDKVVLARRTTLYFDQKIDPFALVAHLQPRAGYGTLFLFQPQKEVAFIGLSPERLYHRKGREIFADALAGTRVHGKEDELFSSAKEQREFTFVKQFIHAKLSPLCTSHAWKGEDRILHTATLAHLYNQFHGLLKDPLSDRDLIPLLHPTPAMAGFPRNKALNFLDEEEPFDRGWYAAPLGWISHGSADLVVGIRSALVRGKEVHLFAGVGIVKGSDPKKEWDELNQKVIL